MRALHARTGIRLALAAGLFLPAVVGCGEQNESVPADDQCEVAERVQDEPVDCPEES